MSLGGGGETAIERTTPETFKIVRRALIWKNLDFPFSPPEGLACWECVPRGTGRPERRAIPTAMSFKTVRAQHFQTFLEIWIFLFLWRGDVFLGVSVPPGEQSAEEGNLQTSSPGGGRVPPYSPPPGTAVLGVCSPGRDLSSNVFPPPGMRGEKRSLSSPGRSGRLSGPSLGERQRDTSPRGGKSSVLLPSPGESERQESPPSEGRFSPGRTDESETAETSKLLRRAMI